MEKLKQFAESVGGKLDIGPKRIGFRVGDRGTAIASVDEFSDADLAGMVPLFRDWLAK